MTCDVNGFDDESKFNLLGVFDKQFKPNSTIELSATYPNEYLLKFKERRGVSRRKRPIFGYHRGPPN